MADKTLFKHRPDYAVPPGETLQETLQTMGMSQAELAQRTGLSAKHINRIVKGIEPISPETAISLEKVLGIPASLWNGLEKNYREQLARIGELQELKPKANWLKQFPVRSMIQMKWIKEADSDAEQVKLMLEYFGVAGPDQWKNMWMSPDAVFKSSTAFKSEPGAVSAWLRQGEIQAQKMDCGVYDRDRFIAVQGELRKLTSKTEPEEFVGKLREICGRCGVVVLFIPELPKTCVFGATRWVNGRPVIQLSLRHKTNDLLWFTFFHECGHITLHGKKEVFLEEKGMKDGKEEEANRYARNILIPEKAWQEFRDGLNWSKDAIARFSNEQGIAPGIVLGRLQFEDILPYNRFVDLKVHYQWVEED